MKLCSQINEAISNEFELHTSGTIIEALKIVFASYALPFEVSEVEIGNGVITLDIQIIIEEEKSEFELHFFVDEDGIPNVAVFDDEDGDEDFFAHSLKGIASTTKGADGITDIVNLIEPSWLTEAVMMDILMPDEDSELEAELEEATTFVIRDGKKVKKKLVISRRRKVLTAKQKAGIRKAVKTRKSKKGQTARKRKISNKLRKRMKLKKNTNKRLKVAGTSSRK